MLLPRLTNNKYLQIFLGRRRVRIAEVLLEFLKKLGEVGTTDNFSEIVDMIASMIIQQRRPR